MAKKRRASARIPEEAARLSGWSCGPMMMGKDITECVVVEMMPASLQEHNQDRVNLCSDARHIRCVRAEGCDIARPHSEYDRRKMVGQVLSGSETIGEFRRADSLVAAYVKKHLDACRRIHVVVFEESK